MAKRKMRISGTGMAQAGAFAARGEDASWAMDVCAIGARVSEYLQEASERGAYSVAGLCLALGVSRETLFLWREGYANAQDRSSEDVLPNEALRECADIALLHVERYWEECDKSGVQTKMVKLMEQSGALGGKPEAPPAGEADLGRLEKYSG